MPKYNFSCTVCDYSTFKVLRSPPDATTDIQCKNGHGRMVRAPSFGSSQQVERLDNGCMTKPIERLKEAPQLFHERATGKKGAIGE